MSSAKLVSASLTPANALAKLALSDIYDALSAGHQDTPPIDSVVSRMEIKPTQEYDHDVCQLQRELERRLLRGDGFTSDSLTEPFTDAEAATEMR
ncbi:MAG: hypothetical protein M1829_004614 [Trizodia sp. TS-e1964]|nr:MAG: hypothetical protein M1829_004614 [Trizodia sp. TS-e1964]